MSPRNNVIAKDCGTTGIQTKAPYDKTHLLYLVANMVMLVADMVVADMV